ncbi:MAG: hypothetical protein ACRC50_05865 [Gaiella sp.]
MPRRAPSSGSMWTRTLAASGLAVLLLGSGYAVVSALGEGDGGAEPEGTTTQEAAPTTPARPRAPRVARVKLVAVGAFDPEGDGRESDELAARAVDGDVRTAWATERYESFFKSGVGLVLDAGSVRRLQRLDLLTGTPGFSAEIRAGASPRGPFVVVGPEQRVDRLTQFSLGGRRARFVVVWVTDLPDGSAAEVAEVRLRARRVG